jgi:hypothetical protein
MMVGVHLTGWFWLALLATVAVPVSAWLEPNREADLWQGRPFLATPAGRGLLARAILILGSGALVVSLMAAAQLGLFASREPAPPAKPPPPPSRQQQPWNPRCRRPIAVDRTGGEGRSWWFVWGSELLRFLAADTKPEWR